MLYCHERISANCSEKAHHDLGVVFLFLYSDKVSLLISYFIYLGFRLVCTGSVSGQVPQEEL